MKTLIFTNANENLRVEYVTDLINDEAKNFTVMEIRGVDDIETIFGMLFQKIENDIFTFKQFAIDNNLKLEIEQTDLSKDELVAIATALDILTTSLPNGVDSVAYSETLVVEGGNGPFLWAVTSGALPDGLVLDPSSGVIDGTPTTVETQAFEVTVTDLFAVQDTQSLSIEITS